MLLLEVDGPSRRGVVAESEQLLRTHAVGKGANANGALRADPFARSCASRSWWQCRGMLTAVDAIYEHGHLRLLHPLPLPENTPVRMAIELPEADPERRAWLEQSEQRLRAVWDNPADDVYTELLDLPRTLRRGGWR